ncbi:hypothetical protein SBRY_30737 [Actinacidiphila bryophytorum]|uniref:Uncharacterized protein n=1 Tax=Actinacidiphila bryophytorum TaxID=1436133 RepID=A0A9W4H1K3_9ACTN|nr:hypothetical protein SBRY_30737 [Actinacidiphila bryophytorum]
MCGLFAASSATALRRGRGVGRLVVLVFVVVVVQIRVLSVRVVVVQLVVIVLDRLRINRPRRRCAQLVGQT